MMTETLIMEQPLNIQANFPEKAAPVMNSQGEVIQAAPEPCEQPSQQAGPFDDVIELWDTAFALPADCLYPATDDTGMEHKIISCGHVLKSTHDLARWSEKTGARRVNTQESIDAITDLAVNLEPNRTPRRRLTNTASSGGDPTSDIKGLFEERKGGKRNTRGGWQQQQPQQKWQPIEGEKSEIINCWPVLKSTHDKAQLSEKRGKNAVNKAETSEALDELALNQTPQQCAQEFAPAEISASGNSLQSGMDTQAGSHMAMDCQQ